MSSSYNNNEIDPDVLADVTRVVQELMRMQKQQQEEQEAENYNMHSHHHTHDPLDGVSSVSRGDFDDRDVLEHADRQDVEIELLSVQGEQTKGQEEFDQSMNRSWTEDEPPLLPSSTSTSSLFSSSSTSSSTASTSSSSSYKTASSSLSESASGSILLPPFQVDELKGKDPSTPSPTYLAAPTTLGVAAAPLKATKGGNEHDSASSNGSTHTPISQLPGQKTPTRATTNTKGPTDMPDAPDHKYFDHDNDTIPQGSKDSAHAATKANSLKPGALGAVPSKGAAPSSTAVVPRVIPLPPTRPRRKKALLIGINYFGDPNQLLGCINDTRDVFGFLNGYYGFRYQDTIMLTDDQIYEDKRPTAANIRYWMKWLVKDAEPQDSLFFHYAVGDETDGYDEIIYPCDYLRTGIISDDEMYDLLVKELPAGVQLTALVDACHSGTMLDLPYVYNGNHVTALEKVTRTKVGAMAAMSASMDVVFDLPGSNNATQTQTTTTTTTTTTTMVTLSASNSGTSTPVIAQYTDGAVTTTDGHLAPPGGVPAIHVKEGGSPLIGGSPQAHSKRSIFSADDSNGQDGDTAMDECVPRLTTTDCGDVQNGSCSPEQRLARSGSNASLSLLLDKNGNSDQAPASNNYPTFQLSEPTVTDEEEQTVASLWPPTATTGSSSLLSVADEGGDLHPSPRKRSKSVHNMGILGVSEMDHRGIECDSEAWTQSATETQVDEAETVVAATAVAAAVEETSVVAPQQVSIETENEEETDDEGMEEARKMALFRKTKGNVVMFSGCRDDQASADIRASAKDAAIIADHHKKTNAITNWNSPSQHDLPDAGEPNPLGYSLPQPYTSPMARGAVSYAWIQCLSQKREQTYEELLTSMRHFMKQRDLDQVPQLGSGKPMDMRTIFSF
ncbi:Ca(2+)-dependent cysteine protease [Linnemannia elongata]|nr:Ca(2+)-dependent cysteine protease [Linnemannia elongata]